MAFHADERGFTGAERALALCCGLAIVALAGHLISQGSADAAGGARQALITHSGGGRPLQLAGMLPAVSVISTAGPQRQPAPVRALAAAVSAPAPASATYTVTPGDTLSAIAARELGDSSRWQEIYDLNRGAIGDDPSLIQVGMQLQLPGGGPAPPPVDTGGGQAPVGDAAEVARQFLGMPESELQFSGQLDMDAWVPQTVDCANFVSGCLEKAGLITPAQHSDRVVDLAANLRDAGWRDVPLADARPGDVVCFDGPDGDYQHVELFNDWVDGKPQFIGSNNVLADGTQAISYDSGAWAYRFHVLTPP